MNVYEKTIESFKEASRQMSMSSGNPKKLAEAFQREHNTNQQSIVRLLHGMIEELSKQEHGIDGRNHESYKWFREVAKIEIKYFPFI